MTVRGRDEFSKAVQERQRSLSAAPSRSILGFGPGTAQHSRRRSFQMSHKTVLAPEGLGPAEALQRGAEDIVAMRSARVDTSGPEPYVTP